MAKARRFFECPVCQKLVSMSVLVCHIKSRHRDEFDAMFLEFSDLKSVFENTHTCKCGQPLKATDKWFNGLLFARLSNLSIYHFYPQFCNARCRNKFKSAWNLGLTKDTSDVLAKMSIDRMGDKNPIHKVIQDEEKYDAWRRELSKSLKGNLKGVNLVDKVGEEGALITRAKMSSSARSREVHGHKGCQHTDETKEILRRKTAQHISSSERKVSNVQRRLYEELKNKLGDEVLLEHQFHFYSIDIVYRDIAIEVDGDFWHANEAKGFTVKHNVQIKNKVNDINKDKYLAKNGWRVIRVWESDINDDIENVVKEIEDAARS